MPDICELLGQPLQDIWSANDHHALGYGLWEPQWLGDVDADESSADVSHLRFLLRIASAKAAKLDCNLFALGKIGWKYSENDTAMNPETALAMLEHGYVYTERYAK